MPCHPPVPNNDGIAPLVRFASSTAFGSGGFIWFYARWVCAAAWCEAVGGCWICRGGLKRHLETVSWNGVVKRRTEATSNIEQPFKLPEEGYSSSAQKDSEVGFRCEKYDLHHVFGS